MTPSLPYHRKATDFRHLDLLGTPKTPESSLLYYTAALGPDDEPVSSIYRKLETAKEVRSPLGWQTHWAHAVQTGTRLDPSTVPRTSANLVRPWE